MSRRVLTSMLDAGVERPEKRVFKVRIKKVFRQRRGELVSALLTVLRAARLAQDGDRATEARAARRLRGMVRLGARSAGVARPRRPCRLGRDQLREQRRPRGAAGRAAGMAERGGSRPATLMQPTAIVAKANPMGTLGESACPDLRAALLLVAEDPRSTGSLSAKRLGWWLKDVKNKPIGDLRLVKVELPRKPACWMLEENVPGTT